MRPPVFRYNDDGGDAPWGDGSHFSLGDRLSSESGAEPFERHYYWFFASFAIWLSALSKVPEYNEPLISPILQTSEIEKGRFESPPFLKGVSA